MGVLLKKTVSVSRRREGVHSSKSGGNLPMCMWVNTENRDFMSQLMRLTIF